MILSQRKYRLFGKEKNKIRGNLVEDDNDNDDVELNDN
jgi:hypothetical protein